MRLLVTGATGFIGRRLIPAALATGHEAMLLLREQHRDGQALPAPLASLPAVYADLRDREGTRRAVEAAAPEAVLHLAAAGVTAPFLPADEAVAHNVLGTIHLLEASAHMATRIVVARTPGEREALNVYAASKAAAWQFCRMAVRTRGLPIVGAMIFQAYGPGQAAHNLIPAAMAAARAGANFKMTPGNQVRDWIRGRRGGLLAALLPASTGRSDGRAGHRRGDNAPPSSSASTPSAAAAEPHSTRCFDRASHRQIADGGTRPGFGHEAVAQASLGSQMAHCHSIPPLHKILIVKVQLRQGDVALAHEPAIVGDGAFCSAG